MASKIEQTIEDIYDYLETCKFAAFSNKESIIVNRDDLFDLLEELKSNIPEEIKHSRQIVANRDAILENAKANAQVLLAKAEEKQGELVEKNAIMQEAYSQAQEVVNQANANALELLNQATTEANAYQMSAMRYTDDSLAGISDILTKAINDAQSRYSDLISSLSGILQVVNNDRAQLQIANDTEQVMIPGGAQPQGQVQVKNRGAQPQAQTSSRQGEAPKAPVVDRANSIREEIDDDDIDDI
ncbi:MAG: ATPase [Lachnospiraceae bacterium]|nr:ATPase [Lachnospiraceae bacterium]